MKKIAIIGATGSIGRQAIEIVESNVNEYSLTLVSANSNAEKLAEIACKYKIPYICYTGSDPNRLSSLINYPCRIFTGEKALEEGSAAADYDIFLNSVLGISALKPTLIAIEKGARIAMANKEMLVCAGDYVMQIAKKKSTEIIPVDSEHSAIFQCLKAGKLNEVDELIITSSGGAFRDVPLDMLANMKPEAALKHPNWAMGAKITIDCATMVNKGFEVIEAMKLFDMPFGKIKTILHRQSIVHSMVRYVDGAVIAQLGMPDMKLPIQYAFTYPNRCFSTINKMPLDLSLTFEEVDYKRYPCFELALECAKKGGLFGAALMSADSIVVPAYLKGDISFNSIYDVLFAAVNHCNSINQYTIEDVFSICEETEKYTIELLEGIRKC